MDLHMYVVGFVPGGYASRRVASARTSVNLRCISRNALQSDRRRTIVSQTYGSNNDDVYRWGPYGQNPNSSPRMQSSNAADQNGGQESEENQGGKSPEDQVENITESVGNTGEVSMTSENSASGSTGDSSEEDKTTGPSTSDQFDRDADQFDQDAEIAVKDFDDLVSDVKDQVAEEIETLKEKGETVLNRGRDQLKEAGTELYSEIVGENDGDPPRVGSSFANPGEEASVATLKRQLLIAAASTNRGFSATRAQSNDIRSIIGTLEGMNPERDPNHSSNLEGTWMLIFTNAFDVLVLAALPLIELGEVYQNIEFLGEGGPSSGIQVENLALLQPALAPVLNRIAGSSVLEVQVLAKAEREGGRRLNISFESQKLTPKTLLGRTVSNRLPPLKLQMKGLNSGFIDTTYLDDELRISRSIGDNVFVLLRVPN